MELLGYWVCQWLCQTVEILHLDGPERALENQGFADRIHFLMVFKLHPYFSWILPNPLCSMICSQLHPAVSSRVKLGCPTFLLNIFPNGNFTVSNIVSSSTRAKRPNPSLRVGTLSGITVFKHKSASPQIESPSASFSGSLGHRSQPSGKPSPSLSCWSGKPVQMSWQSGTPSPSESVSGTPQPHTPGSTFSESSSQRSWQSGVPSPSESVSGTPQPQAPGSTLSGSSSQRS